MRYIKEIDNKIVVSSGGRSQTRVMVDNKFKLKDAEYIFNPNTKEIELSTGREITYKKLPEFTINERFKHLETFVDMTIERHTNSVIICGDAGLGKSYTVMERLDNHHLEENEDYTVHKGYTTPKGLYSMLYENRNGIIVIDDMDSVFKDSVSLNLLKAALDSYSKRIVTWNSMGFIDDGLPKTFEFTGQIIFITNKRMNDLDEAVKSRSLCVDVSMTTEEKLDRMRSVANKILPEIKLSTKLDVLSYIDEKRDCVKELNFRTFIKATAIFEATGDKRAVEYMLYNS